MTHHVKYNSGENEWYTPPDIIESARAAVGSIDCDPASSDAANNAARAARYFTVSDDGLSQKWFGNVWMNPPYSRGLVEKFCSRLVDKFNASEIKQACVLVNNATETRWMQQIFHSASAVCFVSGRVKFLNKDGVAPGRPLQGQMIFYFGSNQGRFLKNFSKHGFSSRLTGK